MEMFVPALVSVGLMLIYIIPGFISVKTKMLGSEHIKGFVVILMYYCQTCLTISSLAKAEYSWDLFWQALVFFAIATFVQILMLVVFYFVFKKRGVEDVRFRVATTATSFGNVGFMGVPLLEAIFPGNNDVMLLFVMFMIGLNLLGWTIGSAIIAQDKKYISIKKVVINPVTIGLVVGLPIFFFGLGSKIPKPLFDLIDLMGKMSTPISMIILGMRLGDSNIKDIFNSPLQYLAVALKQILMPMIGLLLIWFIPLDLEVRQTMFILCAAPAASIVLSFAELIGDGQKTAANIVILGTLTSVITIPILMLLMNILPNIYA